MPKHDVIFFSNKKQLQIYLVDIKMINYERKIAKPPRKKNTTAFIFQPKENRKIINRTMKKIREGKC